MRRSSPSSRPDSWRVPCAPELEPTLGGPLPETRGQPNKPRLWGPEIDLRRLLPDIVIVMSAKAEQDRLVVALAAVTCGRLSRAAAVRADRGQCSASADQYRVKVIEPGLGSARGRAAEHSPEVVLDHWGGDAEMLTLRSSATGAVGLSGPLERARVAAHTVSYYDLDALQIEYRDGAELLAGRLELVLYGPRQGFLRRRPRLLRAPLKELL